MVTNPSIQNDDVQQRGARHVSDDGHRPRVQTGASVLQSERRSIRRLPQQAHIPAEAGPADNLLRGRPHLHNVGGLDPAEQPHPRCEGGRAAAAPGGQGLAAQVPGAHQQRPQRHAACGALQKLPQNLGCEWQQLLRQDSQLLEPLPGFVLQRLLHWPFRQPGALRCSPSTLPITLPLIVHFHLQFN